MSHCEHYVCMHVCTEVHVFDKKSQHFEFEELQLSMFLCCNFTSLFSMSVGASMLYFTLS